MKMFFAILVGSLISFSAHAAFTTSSIFTQIVKSEQFIALEETLSESGFTLHSLSDTGNRYRCPCFDFKAEFKNYEGVTIEKSIRIKQDKVEIK